jgi:hypothetical protein
MREPTPDASARQLYSATFALPTSSTTNGRTLRGDVAPSGLYFIRVRTGRAERTRSVVVLKQGRAAFLSPRFPGPGRARTSVEKGPAAADIHGNMHTDIYYFFLLMGTVLTPLAALLLADRLRTRWLTRDGLNSTADWTPAPPGQVLKVPAGSYRYRYELPFLTSHLEAGETLEGFTRAAFTPDPTSDWRHDSQVFGLPLLFAVTSRRILLFKFSCRTVRLFSFIPLDDIRSLQPPQPGRWGTSGPVRFGLKSGREYRMILYGPLLNREAMQCEQNLAAYLRELAPRYPASVAA